MRPTRFVVHVYDGVEPIDLGGTFGVLSMARRVDPGIEAVLVAEKAGTVVLANGLKIEAPFGYADRLDGDVLMILGGASWPEEARNVETLGVIRDFSEKAIVASVCTGAMILSAAGLLDGRVATTRRFTADGGESPLAQMARTNPDVSAVERRFVDCGAVVTGGGVALAIDTTLHLIGTLRGEEVALEVARLIEYPRGTNDGLFQDVVTPALSQA